MTQWCPMHGFNLSDCPIRHKCGNTVMVVSCDQGEMLLAFLPSFKKTVCYLQMRADCMRLALDLMRQWRSITPSHDLASLVLLASFQALGKFGRIKLIKPKSNPSCDKLKVDFLSVFQLSKPSGQSNHLLCEAGGKPLSNVTSTLNVISMHYVCMQAVSLSLWAPNTHAANLYIVHILAIMTACPAACRTMQLL
jgi:hypothetical protein